MAWLGVYPDPESADVVLANQRVKLSPAQTEARQQAVGEAVRRAAQSVILSPGYARLTDQARRDLLERDLARARRAADKQFADRLRAHFREPHAQ